MTLKAGDVARLIQPELKGIVIARRFNDQDQLEVCLEWTDSAGDLQHRWFVESLLEVAA
jgi:hypothetical protein